MSQLSSADGPERAGSSTLVSAGSAGASSTAAPGSVSLTPPPPEPPRQAAQMARHQPASRTLPSGELIEDELGPSLTSAQLMRGPVTELRLPDLSVSNDALLASLQPVVEHSLGARMSRVAREQGQRAIFWFGTRPSWLQAVLSVAGGTVVGLSLVVAYARAFHPAPEPEVAAEPASAPRAATLAAAAAPAALVARSVVQPLAAAPAPAQTAAPTAPAAPAADELPTMAGPARDDTAANEESEDEESAPRKSSKRQRASKSSSSSKLPAWLQQRVKPQVERAAARERRAALREKRAAALREKKARRSRARAREQE